MQEDVSPSWLILSRLLGRELTIRVANDTQGYRYYRLNSENPCWQKRSAIQNGYAMTPDRNPAPFERRFTAVLVLSEAEASFGVLSVTQQPLLPVYVEMSGPKRFIPAIRRNHTFCVATSNHSLFFFASSLPDNRTRMVLVRKRKLHHPHKNTNHIVNNR